uniref:exocyst complex component 3-like n=1 Tax=Myxine glutinosa TaxID=7769 RepID=UPI00358EA35C
MASRTDLTIEELEQLALGTAVKRVSLMLQYPDQIDRVEQYRKREARTTSTLEMRLKSALQSQLEGVCLGLSQLHEALEHARHIRSALGGLWDELQTCSAVAARLGDVKALAEEHAHLASAMEHMKIICSVRELERQALALAEDGHLLKAHQQLAELEASRDSLLQRQHGHGSSAANIRLIRHYFAGTEALAGELNKQVWLVLQRALGTARHDPALLVSALRIVQREENLDKQALVKQQQTGFLPPGRPKELRKGVMEVLENTVQTRVEGGLLESREGEPMWLMKHLELLRKCILEDLRVVKTLVVQCFPPHYKPFATYLALYQGALAAHIQELASDEQQPNEMISLLAWVLHVYPSKDMMGHPDLVPDVNVAELEPPLFQEDMENIQDKYLQTLQCNFSAWLTKALETDVRDWSQSQEPEANHHGLFHTSLPGIVFQIMEQNLQVAFQVSSDLSERVLHTALQEVQGFLYRYRMALGTFKQEHVKDRKFPPFYVQYMIAAINNCTLFSESVQTLKRRYLLSLPTDKSWSAIPKIESDLSTIAAEGCTYLLDEVLLDIKPSLLELLTRPWLTSSKAMDTICITIEDYFNDFSKLNKSYLKELTQQAHRRILHEYVHAIVQRRVTLRSQEERQEAADKMECEGKQLKQLFQHLSEDGLLDEESRSDVIPALGEIISLKDTSMLCLDISSLINRYPDIREEHICAVLSLRGDSSREMRLVVSECMMQRDRDQDASDVPSIFTSIAVASCLLPQLPK